MAGILANKKIYFWFVPVVAGLLLSACGTPIPQTSLEEPIEQPTVATASVPANLPKLPLTNELLTNLLAAELSYYRNDHEFSLDTLKDVAVETQDPRIAETVTIRAIRLRRFDIASRTATLWTGLQPESSSAWYANAITLMVNQDYESMVDSFLKMLEYSNRKRDELFEEIANSIANNVDPELAYELYSALIANYSDNTSARLQLVNMAIRSGKPIAETGQLLDAVFELSPASDRAALIRFSLDLENQQESIARMFAKTQLVNYPDSPLLRNAYARHLDNVGLYPEAVQQFKKLTHSRARFSLGLVYAKMNDLERSRESILAYHSEEPNDQFAILHLAELALDLKKYDEAQEWISRLMSSELGFERRSVEARYIAETRDLDEGIALLLEDEAQTDEIRIRSYLTIDELYRNANQLENSKFTLDEALVEYPDNSTLLLARSYVAAELNLISLVESDIRILLEQNPNNPNALNALGYTLADQTDRFEEALDLIEQALEFRPHDPYILDSMGWVQYKLGNLDSAIEFLKIALERRNDPAMAAHLGEVYWIKGEKRRARKIWNNAIKLSPDSKILTDTMEKFTN